MSGIPFPKMHIAESVLNRIQNALEDSGPFSLTTPEMAMPPTIANPLAQGLEIEEETSKDPMEAAPPPGLEESAQNGLVESSLAGGSPFDGALLGSLPY